MDYLQYLKQAEGSTVSTQFDRSNIEIVTLAKNMF